MKREIGIGKCGLACALCSEKSGCGGCHSDSCPGISWCENRRCSSQKHLVSCYECPESECRKGLLQKTKPYGFTLFIRRYGLERLLDCLEQNEKNGIVYHRQGIIGDYDDFDDVEELLRFIMTGKRTVNN